MTQLLGHLAANPWLLATGAGFWLGWQSARRSTRYMLGGRY